MPQPRLDIRHLQMLREIWRSGRVNEAAQVLGLTPSALSHRSKEAERRLGVPLFERTHKRVGLTAAAAHLAETADRVLRELERVEDEVRRMTAQVDHVVRLAVDTYEAYGWLPAVQARLAQEAPRISLRIVTLPAGDMAAALLSERVDLVLGPTALPTAGLQSQPLFSDRLVFVCAADHRLAGRDRVTGQDIEGERFITYAKQPAPDQEFAHIFRPEGRYPRWAETVESPAAILALVAAGQGSSILSAWAVAQMAPTCTTVDLGVQDIPVTWQLHRRDEAEAPVARVAGVVQSVLAP